MFDWMGPPGIQRLIINVTLRGFEVMKNVTEIFQTSKSINLNSTHAFIPLLYV